MDANTSNTDVLHSANHSSLSPEEIAKALQRHNRHHPGNQQNASANAKPAAKRR